MTTLPLKSESFTGFPSTSFNCHSGATFFKLGRRGLNATKKEANAGKK
jgi:hypothetical protein